MKLLSTENLSPSLVVKLADIFPGAEHVRNVGLASADDDVVWQYAKRKKLVIVSKDSDFHQRSFLLGSPPKVVWLKCGNRSTAAIEAILRQHEKDLRFFDDDEDAAFLVVAA